MAGDIQQAADDKKPVPSYMEGTAKPPKKKDNVKQVVQGNVSVKKKPAAKRLRESLGLEETRTVGDYLVWDVLLPAAKEMVADLVKKGIDVFLYGGEQAPKGKNGTVSKVSYGSYYNRNDPPWKTERGRDVRRSTSDFREYVFSDRRDAEAVLSEMCEIVDMYGFCKVSDFYSLVGETERNFTGHGYGWDHLGSARVERVRDGWIVELPKPIRMN